jgi:hypothetical protein
VGGWLDKIGRIADAFGGAVKAPFGLVTDLASAPFDDDDDFGGFVDTVRGYTAKRGGEYLKLPSELGVTGAAKWVGREALLPAAEGAEWLWREGVSQPLTTDFLAQNRAADNRFERVVGTVFGIGMPSAEDYRAAEKQAENTSPGQALAYGVMNADAGDPDALKDARDTRGFGTFSGSIDVALRLFADPTVVVADVAAAARTAKLVKPISGSTDLDRVAASSRFGRFNEAVGRVVAESGDSRVAAARIRDRFFPNDTNGAAIATVLAEAGDTPTRTRVLRAMMGDGKVLDEIRAERADIAGALDRLTGQQSILNSLIAGNFDTVNRGARPVPVPLPDSKVRDQAGNLIRVFHGTNSDFDKFDDAFTDPDSWYGKGHYFTEDSDYAQSYTRRKGELRDGEAPNVKVAYLDIKNPANYDEPIIPIEDAGRIARKLGLDPDRALRSDRLNGGLTDGKEAYSPQDLDTLFFVGDDEVIRSGTIKGDKAFKDALARHEKGLSLWERQYTDAGKPSWMLQTKPAAPQRADFEFVSQARFNEVLQDYLKSKGFDGIVHRELISGRFGLDDAGRNLVREGGVRSYVVFSADQIHAPHIPQPDPPYYGPDVRPEDVNSIQREIDMLYPAVDRLARQEAVFAKIRNEPRARVMDTARTNITRSDFYQRSKFAAPLRVTFNMQSHRMVDLNRPDGDVQVSRLLQKSKLPDEQQLGLRGAYMAAQTPGQRQAALIKAEDAAVASLATDAGMTADELAALLQQANKGRQTAAEMVRSRVYDGQGRSMYRYTDDVDGVTHEVHLPLLVSQEANILPLVNMDELRQAITRVGTWRKRFPSGAIPKDMLDGVYKVWKPSVLLRVGWPIRVVGDEQLRIMGKIGALASLTHLHAGISNSMANELDRALAVTTRAPGVSAKEAARKPKKRIGQGKFKVGDYELEKAFGPADAQPNVFFDLSSSRDNFNRFIGQEADEQTAKLREATGEWRSITPDEKSYGAAWERAVNQQIGSDAMGRLFLQGKSVDEVTKWLRATEEGRAYARRLPYRRANLNAWAGRVAEQVESYTLGNPEIAALALKGNATASDLARVVPNAAERPVVHGEILADALGKGPTAAWFNNTVQGLWKALGSKPSDTLSRHPYFSAVYEAEARRLTELMDHAARKNGERLRESDLLDVQHHAREYALGETKKTLYSLAEQSDLAAMLKFISPFYSAWQETMTTWAGIAIDNPTYIARLTQVWQAPEAAGLITDEDGNTVGPGDRPYDSEGNPTEQRYVTLRLPRWAKDWPGMENQGAVRFDKRSFNLMLQGAPGFGPVVQVPVNEIVKDRPDLEQSVKFVLPLGSSQSSVDLFLPSTAKRLQSLARGEEDAAYRNALLKIYTTKLVDYNTGKRKTRPTYAEAKKETNAFFALRSVASWVSPAAPGFQSPYQPYIDAYQQLKKVDPRTADAKFLEQYGEEYFPLTQSVTRSTNGIPPTVEAYKAGSKYADIIDEHPELGGLIVGAEGAGEFSRAVYNAQTATPLEPGSDVMQRQTFSAEEFAKQPSIRLGWIKYSKAMALVEAARVARGLPNLQVKEANDLALLKQMLTAQIEEAHPEWADKRAVFDRNAMKKRLTGLRDLAADDRLAQRSEFQGLREYFDVREVVRAALLARAKDGGAASLDAAGNQDLAFLWEAMVGKITEQNLAFGDLYSRFLERDTLEAA